MRLRRMGELAVFPLLVLWMGVLATVGPSLDLAGRLSLSPMANGPLVLVAALALCLPLIALLERWLPYRAEWGRPHGDVRGDLLHFLFSGTAANALFGATLLGVYLAAAGGLSARIGGTLWPTAWPLAAQLALAIWLAELGHYAFHRLSHERPLVWRLHAVHHSAPRLYWLNAARFQVLDLFWLVALQTLPLIVLGAGPSALLAYGTFQALYGQLQHANVDVRTGPLDFVFSTPGIHRWHHSRDTREGNHNYGAILSFWDLAFGSFFRPRGQAFAGPVGIADLKHFPRGFLAQQLSPFRWSRVRRESAAAG